jgi:hypothetical protein
MPVSDFEDDPKLYAHIVDCCGPQEFVLRGLGRAGLPSDCRDARIELLVVG